MDKALIIRTNPIIRITFTNIGSLKKLLIDGDARYKAIYITRLIIILKKNTVL